MDQSYSEGKEKISKDLKERVDGIDRLVDNGTISEGLGYYARGLIAMELPSWKSTYWAKQRDKERALRGLFELSQVKNLVWEILFNSFSSVKNLEENYVEIGVNDAEREEFDALAGIAHDRFREVDREVELALEGRYN